MLITKKLVISNTLWSAVAQVGVIGINLLVLPLFIRNLGADLYGIWVLSGVVLGYLNVFDFGFTQGLQKYVAEARVKKDDRDLSEVVVSGVGLLFFIGLLLLGSLWIAAPSIVVFFNVQPQNQIIAIKLLKVSALFCVVMWPLRIVDVVLNASMRIKELSFLNAFKTGAQSVVMLGMVWMAQDIVSIKWVTAGGVAICSTCGLVLIRKYVPEICWNPVHFQVDQIKRMHKFSLGMFYAAVVGLFSIQIDTLIIGKFLTMGEVTAYAVAAKPFQMIQQVAGLFMRTIIPATYTLGAQKDRGRLEVLVSQGVRVRSLVTIPSCVIGIMCIPDFIQLWVGPDFSGVIGWSQYFLFVPVFACLGVGANVCKAVGGVRLVNSLATAKIILNFVISIALVKPLGVGGPILGTVISNFVLGDMAFFSLYCRRIRISPLRGYLYFFQILIVALFAGTLGWLGGQWIYLDGILGLGLQVAFAALMQVICIGAICFSSKMKLQAMQALRNRVRKCA